MLFGGTRLKLCIMLLFTVVGINGSAIGLSLLLASLYFYMQQQFGLHNKYFIHEVDM